MIKKLENTLKRYTSISAVIDMLCRKELALLDPQNWDDRNDRHFMNLYKKHTKAKGLYAACFTQVAETYHHWHIFGGGKEGACVEFRRSDFEKHIKGNPNLTADEVSYCYIDHAEEMTNVGANRLPFMKRMGFEPEAEYRLVAISRFKQEPALALPIDLKLVRQVYINPWLPETIYESLRSVMRKIEGGSHIKISRSRLINSPRWKDAGNRIVGTPEMGHQIIPVPKPSSKTIKASKSKRSIVAS
jgi:hypothetical protein